MKKDRISFIGGDKRTLFAADELAKSGMEVVLAGFDCLKSYGRLRLTELDDALEFSDIIVLPLTGIYENKIYAPFSEDIIVDEELLNVLTKKLVIMGKGETLRALNSQIRIYDLLKREDFAVMNAQATAEGALQIAMENYEGVLLSTRILVLGYGRIGRILSKLLRSVGANVTVATENDVSAAYIYADGNLPVKTSHIKSIEGYDIVFNTVPALVLTETILKKSNSDTLLIELASYPGGIAPEAEKLGFTVVRALGLPGKCSPKTAGQAISNAILTIKAQEEKCE